MATDYTPLTGIGILLDLSSLDVEMPGVPSCEHPERLGQRFCPTCGKKVLINNYVDSTHSQAVRDHLEVICERPLIFEQVAEDEYFLGYGMTIDRDEQDRLPLPDLSQLDQDIADLLEGLKNLSLPCDPEDLVVKDSFGLHAAMHGY